jgi:hypothetical protein
MGLVNFLRSTAGRVLSVLAGFALIVYGAIQVSLVGLILMMVGVVPAVTGLAGICLRENVSRRRNVTRAVQGRRREGRA